MTLFAISRASDYKSCGEYDKDKLTSPCPESFIKEKTGVRGTYYYNAIELSDIFSFVEKHGAIIIQEDYLECEKYRITIYDDYVE